jgi:RNA polymerase sigma-70 factor, ECF subfamily
MHEQYKAKKNPNSGQEDTRRHKPETENITILADLSHGKTRPTPIEVTKDVFDRAKRVLEEKNISPLAVAAGVVIFTAAAVVGGIEIKKARKKKNILPVELTEKQKEEFEAFIDKYSPAVFSFLSFGLGGRDNKDAEDLTQTVFERAYRNYSAFVPRQDLEDPARTWLFSIARNLLKNRYRDESRRHENTNVEIDALEEGKEVLLPNINITHHPNELEVDEDPETTMLRQAVNGLNNRHKLIVYLKTVENLPNEEIAYVMKMSEGAVKSLYFRTLKKLAKKINTK